MPDIRTTRVALLVDREVDRDVQTSRIALLVDREIDVNIIVEGIYLVADIEYNADIVVEDIYLVADIEDGYPWGDILSQSDEFISQVDAGDSENWEDTNIEVDLFTQELVQPENWTDVATWSDKFHQIYMLQDTWDQQDTYRVLRPDLLQLYQDIVNYLNTSGSGPGPDEYDINDDGIITPHDALIVLNWYNTGICTKFLRTTDAWFVHYHNWPNIPRTWSETWTQTQTFQPTLQHLDFSNDFIQIESWYNPGDVNITLPNQHSQLDSFNPSMDLNRISDILNQEDIFDPSFPSKVRSWDDNFEQTSRFDDTNLAHTWVQIEQWLLGETNLQFQHDWVQVASIKPPAELTFSHDWIHTQQYITKTISSQFEHTWVHTDAWGKTGFASSWNDNWHQTDVFQPPLPIIYQDDWSQQELFHLNITTVHLQDIWEQTSQHHSMTQDVLFANESGLFFNELLGVFTIYKIDFVRQLQETMNYFEQWQVVLPTEELTDVLTFVSEFEFNPPTWEDTWTQQETWNAVTGFEHRDIFEQEQSFTYSRDPLTFINEKLTQRDSFNFYQAPECSEILRGMFTLIDEIETLELRNARWGNKITVEQTRVIGATRSGTPFAGRKSYWPQQTTYTYTISHLTDEQFDNILIFLGRNLAKQFLWLDHYGKRHRGYCPEPATPVRRRSLKRGEISLTLVDIGEPECHFSADLRAEEEYLWA